MHFHSASTTLKGCAWRFLFTAVALATLPLPETEAAVLVGYTDTFSSGLSSGWMNGEQASISPQVVATGGPAGTGDRYLRVETSGTHNTQSRLVTFNSSANWTGDYLAAGVTAIEMDLKNFGDILGSPITLQIRIAIKEGSGSKPGYSSLVSVTVPNDGQWHHATFSLLPADLVASGSNTLSLEELLQNPGEIRILHSAQPAVKGDLVNGIVSLGIDNIRIVPEPATGTLLAVTTAVLSSRRRSRRG